MLSILLAPEGIIAGDILNGFWAEAGSSAILVMDSQKVSGKHLTCLDGIE